MYSIPPSCASTRSISCARSRRFSCCRALTASARSRQHLRRASRASFRASQDALRCFRYTSTSPASGTRSRRSALRNATLDSIRSSSWPRGSCRKKTCRSRLRRSSAYALPVRAPCLILIGEGPQQRMLDARAQELAPNVIVLRWQADLAAYYHQADVFLLTSHYESYGRTLVEAAACRLPFVSSDVGVAGALAAEGAVGIVCRSRSAEAYADALLRILDRERGADTERSIDAAFRLNSASLEEYLARYRDLLERCIACAP